MKYITAMVLGFFALIGWMRKYTGIIMILFAFLTCSLFYKNDVIGLIKEQRQQEERQQIRKEKLEQEEQQRKRLELQERKKEQKEQQEAKAKELAKDQIERDKRAAIAAKEYAKQQKQQLEQEEKQKKQIEEQALLAFCVKPQVWNAVPIYVNYYTGKVRFDIVVRMNNGMPTQATVENLESYPVMSEFQKRLFQAKVIEPSVAKWSCYNSGTVSYNYTFNIE